MLVKILERTWVIRCFGVALIVAPFLNRAIANASIAHPAPWTVATFWQAFKFAPLPNQILDIASLAIGLLTLWGARRAWRLFLGLLGAYILLQLTRLADPSVWKFLAINAVLFVFIADQLVWKVQIRAAPSQPQSTPPPKPVSKPTLVLTPRATSATPARSSRRRIVVDFPGFGHWAQLIDVSNQGLKLRSLLPKTPMIETRETEVSLGADLTLSLKLTKQAGADFFFEYTHISPDQVRRLNRWLERI